MAESARVPAAEAQPGRQRIAIVGSGISGLAAAWRLRDAAQVTLFEAGDYFGGHTNTVDAELDGASFGVDTGFLVLNPNTYPGLLQLFDELDIELAPADMSFSVQCPLPGSGRLEWSGADLWSLFAQPANLLRPRFWAMLADIGRFNREATALALAGEAGPPCSVGEFLQRGRYSQAFIDWYFLPMSACIWSCPTQQMLAFPMLSMARFCHNHSLLQVRERPQWLTVAGGARRYVQRIVAGLDDVRLATPVQQLRRLEHGVELHSPAGVERFDAVILACHSDQALALLADPSALERELLGAIAYQPNRALLHSDVSLLPQRQRAWAAWNFETDSARSSADGAGVCLHYLLNRLQPLPCSSPLLVSLNPLREPDPKLVQREIHYAHPVFDAAAIAAQRRLPELQGQRSTYYCGAWCGYGFHEDGLQSGYAAAAALMRAGPAGAGAQA